MGGDFIDFIEELDLLGGTRFAMGVGENIYYYLFILNNNFVYL